ncbi:hypothetical protein [Bartonella raoultii]|uniref:Uncharacterized protein n=1 Tax=Bartonella raoultii TaxID=1457020 RepID=A0ABS7I618_9HYPH|nr:hypothetical protein [Bartonella raoultii]MBX4336285.1 hypothetical protein [Bartonella raoultii]
MPTKNTLYILLAVIFCFSKIIEVNANLWKGRAQESVFVTMGAQRNKILVQGTNKAFITISDQSTRENTKSIIGQIVKKAILFGIDLVLEKISLKAVTFFKRWVEARFSQSFYNWRDSLYS